MPLITRNIYVNWIFWFFIGNSLLFWGIGLRYLANIIPFRLSVSSLAHQLLACLFLFCAFIGQIGLFACIAAIIPILLTLLFPRKNFILIVSVIIGFLLAYLLCVDAFVFGQYHFHLNGVIWNLLTGGQASEIFDLSHQKLLYPLHPLVYKPIKKPTNILFVLIDSWRFNTLNATHTPNIYRFAEQSWQFQKHFSGGNATQPGLFSLFYSLPASYWSATVNQHKGAAFMDKLLAENYSMGIFTSATLLASPLSKMYL